MAIETQKQHLLVSPTTQPIVERFDSAQRLTDLSNKRVGLIDNSKQNAMELLNEITEILTERYGVEKVNYHAKPSASKPAEGDVILAMAKDCDYVIVAIGS